jgi:IS4 transposase
MTCPVSIIRRKRHGSQSIPDASDHIQRRKTGKIYPFITNSFRLAAIAAICRQRWQIELFFKWSSRT